MVIKFADHHYEEEGRERDDIIEGACTLLETQYAHYDRCKEYKCQ